MRATRRPIGRAAIVAAIVLAPVAALSRGDRATAQSPEAPHDATSHHTDDRLRYVRRLADALAPGGGVVIIDFHKRPLPVGPPPQHKLARDFVVDEMKQAGFRLADEKTFLPYHYFLFFQPGTK